MRKYSMARIRYAAFAIVFMLALMSVETSALSLEIIPENLNATDGVYKVEAGKAVKFETKLLKDNTERDWYVNDYLWYVDGDGAGAGTGMYALERIFMPGQHEVKVVVVMGQEGKAEKEQRYSHQVEIFAEGTGTALVSDDGDKPSTPAGSGNNKKDKLPLILIVDALGIFVILGLAYYVLSDPKRKKRSTRKSLVSGKHGSTEKSIVSGAKKTAGSSPGRKHHAAHTKQASPHQKQVPVYLRKSKGK